MKLTKEEKDLILKKRLDEESTRPKKTATLKVDLYEYDTDDRSCDLGYYRESENYMCLCEKHTMDKWIKEFKEHFVLELPKGTPFVCYIYGDGKEYWFDDVNYGIEEMGSEWASKFLENVKDIPK